MAELLKENILSVDINLDPLNKILEYIVISLKNTSDSYYVVTPNPEIIVYANKNYEYRDVLNNAKIALPDGIGVLFASWLLRKSIKRRITGVDFMDSLCKISSENAITVGFLGGRDQVAEKTADCLRKKYKSLKVEIIAEEWAEDLSKKSVDILFVAFGFPKQEFWMSRNIDDSHARIMIGIGGAFDYYSGKVSRAPIFLRNIGLEWFYRLLMQPWRIKRQFSLIIFLGLLVKSFLEKK